MAISIDGKDMDDFLDQAVGDGIFWQAFPCVDALRGDDMHAVRVPAHHIA